MKIIKKTILALAITIFILIFSLFVYVRFFQSAHNFIIREALDFVNNKIPGELAISLYEGNIFSKFTLHDISLRDNNGELLAYIGKLSMDWNYRELLVKRISINTLEISNLIANLDVSSSNEVNFREVFRTKPKVQKPINWERRRSRGRALRLPFMNIVLNVSVDNLLIKDADADLKIDKNAFVIPDKATFESLQMKIDITNSVINTDILIDNLVAEVTTDSSRRNHTGAIFNLNKLHTNFELTNYLLDFNELNIITDNSNIAIVGIVDYRNMEHVKLNLTSNPARITDYNIFIPHTVDLSHVNDLFLTLNLDFEDNYALVELNIIEEENHVYIESYFEKHIDFFDNRFKIFENNYAINIELFNVSTDFLPVNLNLNSNISIIGENLNINHKKANIDIEIINSLINDMLVENLTYKALVENRNINSELEIISNQGYLHAEINIEDFFTKQEYFADIQLKELDLHSIIDDFYSDINANIVLNGTFFHPDSMVASLFINMSESFVKTEVVDSLFVYLEVDSRDINFDNIRLYTDVLSLVANGKADFLELYNSDVEINIYNPRDFILSYTGFEIDFNAYAHYEAHGKWKNLNHLLNIDINSIITDYFHVENVNALINLNDLGSLNSQNDVKITNITFDKFPAFESIDIRTSSDYRNMDIDINIASENGFNITLDAILNWEEALDFEISNLEIFNELMELKNEENIYFNITGNKIALENFNIHTLTSSITIPSAIKNNNDFHIKMDIQNIDIENIMNTFYEDINLKGFYSISLEADLINNDLEVFTDILISDFSYYLNSHDHIFYIDDIKAKVNYENNNIYFSKIATIDSHIPTEANITLNTTIPFTADFINKEFFFRADDNFYSHFSANKISLDFLNIFFPYEYDINANTSFDIETKGTLENPLVTSVFSINNGNFKNSEWGIDFNNLDVDIKITPFNEKHTISINNISFERDRGVFLLQGQANAIFNFSDWYNKSYVIIEDTNIFANFDSLTLLNNMLVRANATGHLELYNIFPLTYSDYIGNSLITMPDVVLNGAINMNEMRIFFDEIIRYDIANNKEPILVTAQRGDNGTVTNRNSNNNNFQFPSFDVNVNIEIPQNFWIVGQGISFELSGGATIIANQNTPFIDAIFDVTRGYYQYLGKRFVFDEGSITIIGHELDNPLIHVRAHYLFRNSDGMRQRIDLRIEGQMREPEITFYLDDVQIEELDAISWIVFGRESELITHSDSQSNTGLQTAADLLSLHLSYQLSQILQNQFPIDLFEIRGDHQWEQASVTLGRYFGNNLFVSYEQSFDTSDIRDSRGNVLNVEYRINRYFFLSTTQSNEYETGFDVIFRWTR